MKFAGACKAAAVMMLLAAAVPAGRAQLALTTIRDMIYDQAGGLYTGPLTITLSVKSGSSGGAAVVSAIKRLQITAGVLNTALVPNDAISPAGSTYAVAYGNGGQRTCTIPTSATAITLASYCTDDPPASPSPVIPVGWLGPVPVGLALCGSGTGVAAGVCTALATWGVASGTWGGL